MRRTRHNSIAAPSKKSVLLLGDYILLSMSHHIGQPQISVTNDSIGISEEENKSCFEIKIEMSFGALTHFTYDANMTTG